MLIIYTGKGKGKTSAAVGAVIRSIGWGKKVAVVQFVKHETWASGEREVLRKLGVDVFVMGASWVGIMGDTKERLVHVTAARAAVAKALKLLKTLKYDLVVCDEILGALHSDLIERKDVEKIVSFCHPGLDPGSIQIDSGSEAGMTLISDIIFTGQNAPDWLIGIADLVTEMVKVKHPYDSGILAKKGIDF